MVDIELLFGWHADSHDRRPEKGEINGVHSVTGANLDRIYQVYLCLGRKEHRLESW